MAEARRHEQAQLDGDLDGDNQSENSVNTAVTSVSNLAIQVHCITLYYAYQEISWKPGKMSKFQPIHSTIQIWTEFHENEAKKKNFSKKKIQNG